MDLGGNMTETKQALRSLSGRRSFFRSAAVIGAGLWADEMLEALPQNVNRNSKPSELKITDLRVAVVQEKGTRWSRPIVRLDTNQGIQGYGEGYLGSSKTYTLVLKSRLLGENPCNVDRIFRKIKQFGFHARQGSGVSGVEAALWDLAGRAYGAPVYQMLGGKFRDRIRLYGEGDNSPDPKVYGASLKKRLDEGFTMLKMDLGIGLIEKVPGALTRPVGLSIADTNLTEHMFTGYEITDKGMALMCDYMVQVREILGTEVPLAADHFGHIGVNSCISLGRALQKFKLAWLEDMVPWNRVDQWKQITDAIDVPTLTGEDVYLKEGFLPLCKEHAVDMIHPDPQVAGGILEVKNIGNMAQEYGIAMNLHCAATPIGYMAAVHAAAATENFLALEAHTPEPRFWSDMVGGIEKPIVNKGFIKVPETPGLGITVNEEVLRPNCAPGFFGPTTEWDNEFSWDRLWS
jgi:L-alanine-DL-glutamate epimerase-like enolase superfamily enzyme